MSEASQEFFPSQDSENPDKARRKEQMVARKRSSSPAPGAAKEGAVLLCDSWQISNRNRVLIGFVGLACMVPYTTLCLTYPEWTGHIGSRLNLALFSLFGQGALMVPLAIAYLVLSAAGLRPLRKTRYVFAVPLLIGLVLLVERWAHSGGWLGRTLDFALAAAVGPGGAWLFTVTLVILLTLAFFPKAWSELAHALEFSQEYLRESILNLRARLASESSADCHEISAPPRSTSQLTAAQPAARPAAFLPFDDSVEDYPPSIDESLPRAPLPVRIDDSFEQEATLPEEPSGGNNLASSSLDLPAPSAELPPPPAPPLMRSDTNRLGTSLAPTNSTPTPSFAPLPTPLTPPPTAPPKKLGPDDQMAAIPRARAFELPPLALLDDVPPAARQPRSEDKSQALLDALDAFGVKAKLLQIVRGPAVTRYELQPARGVKVSKFTSLTNDIALALASTAVRIEAPIPGKSAIGIEIPNEFTDLVVIKDILRDSVFTESKGLSVALGKDLSGRPVITDLQKMPHLLVAGTTGSGKSVCVNGLILSLLYRFTPDQLQLMMVDPKQVELSVYSDIPHLVGFSESKGGEIIVDPKKAAQALHQVVELMEQRYTLFAEIRVRNLAEYNEKAEAPLPWFVVIIDELADLMMVASKSVETSICRIAQKARAAGIHLVLATQRPSADVITGLIKVNIPSRIAFAVSSQVDSRVILDSGGAEHLLGKGDMLFLPVDASDPKRVQGAYVNNEEIERVVEFWKGQRLPDNRIEFDFKEDFLASDDEDADENSDDALLEEGLRTILNRDQASASMLQTDLKVGYARARRLLMAMEKKGWVSPAEGSKPRKILYSGPSPDTAEGDG